MVQGELRLVGDLPGLDIQAVAEQQGISLGAKLESGIEQAEGIMGKEEVARTIGEFASNGVRPDFFESHDRHVGYLQRELSDPLDSSIPIIHGRATLRMIELAEARAALAQAFMPDDRAESMAQAA